MSNILDFIGMYFWQIVGIIIVGALLIIAYIFAGAVTYSFWWNGKIKRAKKRSLRTYGVSFLYYVFIGDKYQRNFWFERERYPHILVQYYEQLHNLDGYKKSKQSSEYLEQYYPIYREELGLPHIEPSPSPE